MAHQSNKWQKSANQRGGYGVPNEYAHYVVGNRLRSWNGFLKISKGRVKPRLS